MPLDLWKQGEAILAAKLNQPVNAINRMALGAPGGNADITGRTYHWGIVYSVAETGIEDGNANPAQWIPVIHELSVAKAEGYGTPALSVWNVLPEGAGFRGNGYYLSLMGIDGSEVPADIMLTPPEVGNLVMFFLVMARKADGNYVQEAIIITPLNSDCF